LTKIHFLGNTKTIRIAFIKFGGLSAGGTERWLQMMAAHLPRDRFEVDYYYCDAAPYIGSDYRHADTDPLRAQYMLEHGVKLIKFRVGAKDVTTPTHDWVDTDFWEIFEEDKYDLVQTAKAGPPEYPYFLLKLPVVEYVTLSAGVDNSDNIACSIHLSQWQRAQWFRSGGKLEKSAVIPIPAEPPATYLDLRDALGIPSQALVAGFHQRVDEHISSPIPLQAFAMVAEPGRHFMIMGGGEAYRKQAKELGLQNVHFLPHSGDAIRISGFLNTLDIFAHGRSDGETFGTVLAEAMMHGKPCLSHRSKIANAQPETMGPAGLFADGVADYAEKLSRLFSDSEFRAKLARKARPHAEEYYSLESCVLQLGSIYARLLSNAAESASPTEPAPIPYGWSDMGFLYAAELDTQQSLGYHVMTGGIPEEFCVHVTRFFLPRVDVFVDAGANTGLYCWVAAKECPGSALVLVFEPQEVCCRYLRKTIELNNWEDRVRVVQLGLGATKRELQFILSGTGGTFNVACNDNALLPSITVPVDTLDQQVEAQKLPGVDFLKIDVEGYENEVLIGATQTISQHRPILFVELADRISGRAFRNPRFGATLEWLEGEGYRVWKAEEAAGRLVEISAIKSQPQIAMYICLHKEKHASLVPGMMRHAREFRAEKRRRKRRLWSSRLGRLARHPVRTLRGAIRRVRAALDPSPT
jgi:FkbM family methyltransferase